MSLESRRMLSLQGEGVSDPHVPLANRATRHIQEIELDDRPALDNPYSVRS